MDTSYKNLKEILKNKVIVVTTALYLLAGIIMYNLIPMQIKHNSYNEAYNEASAIIEIIKKSRDYHYSILTPELKKAVYNNNIQGMHKYIKDYDINIEIYSSLSDKSKIRNEIISFIELHPDEVFKKRIDNSLIVAVQDSVLKKYFTKTNKQAIGVIQVKINTDVLLQGNAYNVKNTIVLITGLIFFVSVAFYIMNLVQIQQVMEDKNKKINSEILSSFKELNFENEELENSLKEMRTIFNKHIIFSKTDLFGVITEVSEAFCEISGYSEKELLNKEHNIVRHPDMPASAFKGMWGTIQADKVWTGNVKNLKKDNDYYWVHAVVAPNYDADGAKIGYISIRNVIVDKRAIQGLNESLNKLD